DPISAIPDANSPPQLPTFIHRPRATCSAAEMAKIGTYRSFPRDMLNGRFFTNTRHPAVGRRDTHCDGDCTGSLQVFI
ncbi:hypothetical protein AB2C80_32550, partial [Pseudomonas aeruginosa]